ncbi:MAG: hypothetical protein IT292_03485 [Deltaproteobacteria bacterium]|nr:hypothetical protein [Deltaproteobacteria bacterium]
MPAMRKFIFVISLLFISLQLFFSARIISSVQSFPDRTSHLTVAGHFWEHLTFSADDLWNFGAERGHSYNVFSPLPYVSYLPGQFFADFSSRQGEKIARHVSAVLLVILNCLAVYLLGLSLIKQADCLKFSRRSLALLFAVTLTSFPQIGVLNSFINADNYTITVCFFITAFSLYMLRGPAADGKIAVIVGLLGALLLHAKANAYPFIIFLLGVFFWSVLKSEQSKLNKITLTGLALSIIVLIVMPFHYVLWHHLGQDSQLPGEVHLAFMENTFRGRGEFTSDAQMPFYYEDQKEKRSLALRFDTAWNRVKRAARYTGNTFLGDIFKVVHVSVSSVYILVFLLALSLVGVMITFINRRVKAIFATDLIFLTSWFLVLFLATAIPLMLMPIAIQGRLLLTILPLLGAVAIVGMSAFISALKINVEKAYVLSCISWLFVFWLIRFELLWAL